MSHNDNLQQMQNATTSDCSLLNSASNSVCEPMFELEGADFNEEFLKALLNDGVDFSDTETTSTNSVQQGSSATSTSERHSSNLQPLYQSDQSSSDMIFECNETSPSNLQPVLQSNVAKRTIKPRTQLSNQEITRLLLAYMSKALTSQQNASTSITSRNKQGYRSSSGVQTSRSASNTAKNSIHSSTTSEPTDLLQLPKATNTVYSKSTDLQQSRGTTFKSKRKCKKSKSTGTSRTSESSQPMDCSVPVSKEAYRKNIHAKVRPYNSLDLPKVHDPLGLMGPVQQPKVAATSTGIGVMRGGSVTAMESSSSEMDLSPLGQILQTVKTVPNFETTSKHKSYQKSTPTVDKILCNAKEKPQEDVKNKSVSGSSDQVTPISDIFNTVNNLPNLLDIQSVLKYVQKRRAMKKLFRRRSHSAGSIDDLKKESKSSASLKAYTELLKAKSQRLQRQRVFEQSSMNLQSCMTTQSTVEDDDFDFLRSIGIDPNTVTTKQTGSNSALDQQDTCTQLQTAAEIQGSIPSDSLLHSKNSFFPQETPIGGIDDQLLNTLQCPNVSNELPSSNNYSSVLQDGDIQTLDHVLSDLQMPTDVSIDSEFDQMEEVNTTTHTEAEVYFTPEWAHTQVFILYMHSHFIYVYVRIFLLSTRA